MVNNRRYINMAQHIETSEDSENMMTCCGRSTHGNMMIHYPETKSIKNDYLKQK